MWAKLKFWLLQNLISFDQQFNTLLGGYADETLSSRAWRMWAQGKPFGLIFKPFIDFLLFFDVDHCYNAYRSEVERRQSPPEERINS